MAISQHLQQKLQAALGAEAAEDLVTWMDGVESTRADIAELRHEMQIGFARMDAKFDAQFAAMETLIERRTAELLKWSFLFWVGAVTSIAVLAKVLR